MIRSYWSRLYLVMRAFIRKIKQGPFSHLLFMLLLLSLLTWITFKPLVFTNSDVGLRFIQIRSLIAQRWQTLAIPYPTEIDPEFKYVPYYYAYSLVNGRLYFNISPFFPFLVSFLYAAMGAPGLVVVPVAGGVLTAWGMYKLARLSQLERPLLLMWGTVFATPLLFYTAQLWDHTLGTGLAISGMALAAQGMKGKERHVAVIGGILLGLSLGQRPELYLFVIALGVAWLWINWRERPMIFALLAGGIFGVLPIWLFQARWVGHPLGMATATNLLGYGRPEVYPIELDGYPRSVVVGHFLFHIQARDLVTFSATIAALIGILLLVFVLRVASFQKKSVFLLAAACACWGYTIWAAIALTNMVTGLVSTFPLLGFSLAFVGVDPEEPERHLIYRFVWNTTLLYLVGMLLFWPAFGAKIWGSRYLLSSYPLLLYLAFYAAVAHCQHIPPSLHTTLRAIFSLLLVVSIGLQLMGWRFNYVTVRALAVERDTVQSLPADVVLTNVPFWAPLVSSIDDKLFFYTPSEVDAELLLPQLYAHHVRRIAVVSLESEPLSLPNEIDGLTITQIGPLVYQLQVAD